MEFYVMSTIQSIENLLLKIFSRYGKRNTIEVLEPYARQAPHYLYEIVKALDENTLTLTDLRHPNITSTSSKNIGKRISAAEFASLIHNQNFNVFTSALSENEFIDINRTLSALNIRQTKMDSVARTRDFGIGVDSSKTNRGLYSKFKDTVPLESRRGLKPSFIGNLIASGYPRHIKTNNPFDSEKVPVPTHGFSMCNAVQLQNESPRMMDAVTGDFHDQWVSANSLVSSQINQPLQSTSNYMFTPSLNYRSDLKYTIAVVLDIDMGGRFRPLQTTKPFELISMFTSSQCRIYHTPNHDLEIVQPGAKSFKPQTVLFIDIGIDGLIEKIECGPLGGLSQIKTMSGIDNIQALSPLVLGDIDTYGGDGIVSVGGWFIWQNQISTVEKNIFARWIHDVVYASNKTNFEFEWFIDYQNSHVVFPEKNVSNTGITGSNIDTQTEVDLSNFKMYIKDFELIFGDQATLISASMDPQLFQVKIDSSGRYTVWYWTKEYELPECTGKISIQIDSNINIQYSTATGIFQILESNHYPLSNEYFKQLILTGDNTTFNSSRLLFDCIGINSNGSNLPDIPTLLGA